MPTTARRPLRFLPSSTRWPPTWPSRSATEAPRTQLFITIKLARGRTDGVRRRTRDDRLGGPAPSTALCDHQITHSMIVDARCVVQTHSCALKTSLVRQACLLVRALCRSELYLTLSQAVHRDYNCNFKKVQIIRLVPRTPSSFF